MATRAFIGIENSDGTVTYAYHHNDGYVSWLGVRLARCGRREIHKIINRGAMSTIGNHYIDWGRGEQLEVGSAQSREKYVEAFDNSWCDYAYLINKHGTWSFIDGRNKTWRSLKREIQMIGDEAP